MPSIAEPLTAVIGFTLPSDRLDHDPDVYLTYDADRTRPTEQLRVSVKDLRPELDAGISVAEQLATRGFAVTRHESEFLDGIPSQEGTRKYLDQCVELLKQEIGCSHVVAWNSVVRKNEPNVKLKVVAQQAEPETNFVPTERLQPIASVAHVDQDEVWGRELCRRAAGDNDSKYSRCAIINIWRPLHGPVTNAPLAMLDFRELPSASISKHASQFGVGLDIHHSSEQHWGYIRHQMTDEIVFLKCFDSDQGKSGEALYCGHVAVKVDGDAEGVDPALLRPRESIERRRICLHLGALSELSMAQKKPTHKMTMLSLVHLILASLGLRTMSPPLVDHIYTADPSAHSFNGRIYVYPSHDRETNITFNDRGDQYDMVDYHVLSMDRVGDKVTDHGVALKAEDVPWVSKQVWAPDCARGQDGKFYLYFPARDKEGIFRLGVAVSSTPEGPFTPDPEPMHGSFSIDPATFVDDDGSAYIYFGGIWGGQLQCYSKPEGGAFDASRDGPHEPAGKGAPALMPRVAKLSPDMHHFAHPARELQIVDENGDLLGADDHERRFFEASWMHKYNGKYYFSYSTGDTHFIVYAIGDTPYGPFTYAGKILEPVVGWTTHHSIVEHEGKWWLFYHDCELSKGVNHLRSVKAKELKYDAEGRIITMGPMGRWSRTSCIHTMTPEQRAFFLANGWLKVPQGVPRKHIDEWTENAFVRLGWDPNDKATWTSEAYHMPRHREVKTSEHMPEAYDVASDLVGGKDQWDKDFFTTSGDSLIVNVGTAEKAGQRVHPKDTGDWHIDGDWFHHYLDSSDQALLTVVLYTDVIPDGGPTLICPKALPEVLRWLRDHPEGGYENSVLREIMKNYGEEDFVYLNGQAGDVFFGHPMMPHSKSRNHLRRFRAICNPTCTLAEPFNLNRSDPSQYSLIEEYTLRALDAWPGLDWHSTGPRFRFQPRTQAGRDAKVAAELDRMKAFAKANGTSVDSKYLTGQPFEHEKMRRLPPPDVSFHAETSVIIKT